MWTTAAGMVGASLECAMQKSLPVVFTLSQMTDCFQGKGRKNFPFTQISKLICLSSATTPCIMFPQ